MHTMGAIVAGMKQGRCRTSIAANIRGARTAVRAYGFASQSCL